MDGIISVSTTRGFGFCGLWCCHFLHSINGMWVDIAVKYEHRPPTIVVTAPGHSAESLYRILAPGHSVCLCYIDGT